MAGINCPLPHRYINHLSCSHVKADDLGLMLVSASTLVVVTAMQHFSGMDTDPYLAATVQLHCFHLVVNYVIEGMTFALRDLFETCG